MYNVFMEAITPYRNEHFLRNDEISMLIPVFRAFDRCPESSNLSKFFTGRPAKIYPKHSIVLEQGEANANVFFIIRGLLEYVNTNENGSKSILGILGPGDMFNMQPVYCKAPLIGSFSTLIECSITSVGCHELSGMMERDHKLALEMITEMAFVIARINSQMSIIRESPDIRTMRVLHMMAMTHLLIYKEKEPVKIPLSQSDLARIVKTTRYTVSKILTEMKALGILETYYGGMSIKNFTLLKQLVKAHTPS